MILCKTGCGSRSEVWWQVIYAAAYSSVPAFLHLNYDIVGVGLSFCLCRVKPCGLELLGRYPPPPKYINWLFLRVVQRLLGKDN